MSETLCGFNDTLTSSGSNLLVSYGPTIMVDIGFDPTYNANAVPITIPISAIKGVTALVDSGAGQSCIDNLLAAQLGLPVIDRQEISGAGGRHTTNVYLAQIYVPSLSFVIYGTFYGVNLIAGGQVHKALIGRTFLKNFIMNYDGKTGTVKISN